MQAANRPEVYAGHGTHGSPADGNGTGCCGMGAAQNVAAGKRDPPTCTEGGEEVTDAALDAMVEAANARAWEELNRDDPKAAAAVQALRLAMDMVDKAVGVLCKAAEQVADTPETDRIQSLANDLEDLGCDIGAQVERMK